MKQNITTDGAPAAPKFLSQAVVSNGLIFVSGQIHNQPDNTLIQGSTKDKLDQIFKNISTILAAADASINDIVKVVIYVTDMSIMPEFNETYPSFFTEPFPVREAVCVKALPLGAEIEISVIAASNQT